MRGDSGPGRGSPPPPARPPEPEAAGRQRDADVPGQRAEPDAAATEVPAEITAAGQAAARIEELEDQRLRALAEVENVRKRCVSQVARAGADAKAEVARQWLPVLDSLDLALQHAGADPASVVDGVRAVREQALGVLARLGYPRREDLGATFDPSRHEAVAARADPDAPDGSVVDVVRPGYGDGETQLRPAQVIVARSE